MNKLVIILFFSVYQFSYSQIEVSTRNLNVGELGNGVQEVRIPVINQSRSGLGIMTFGQNNDILFDIPPQMDSYDIDYITLSPSRYSGRKFSQTVNFTVDGEVVSVLITGKMKKSSDLNCADFSKNNVSVKRSNKQLGKIKMADLIRVYSDADRNSLFSSDPQKYPYAHFVVLIDNSGSMGGFNKLETLKVHLESLVEEMRPTDYISVLTYNEESDILIDKLSGEDKKLILDKIASIEAGGFTNGKKGIESALYFTRENQRRGLSNQVIMLTDGDFNLGDEHEDLISFLLMQKRSMNYKLSVMTVGSEKENQKEMKSLSKTGNGYYFNLDEGEDKMKMNKMLFKQLST